MSEDDCPSFHCRPSTASTFLPASLSIRQTPTTGTRDFGSAPTVSSEKSILVVWAARPGKANAARATIDMTAINFLLFMIDLLCGIEGDRSDVDGGSTTSKARPKPEGRQRTKEAGRCRW